MAFLIGRTEQGGKGGAGVAKVSHPIQWRQCVRGIKAWTAFQTDSEGRDCRRGKENWLVMLTLKLAPRPCALSQKATGKWQHRHSSQDALGREMESTCGTKVFVRTALSTARTPTE